MNRTRSGPAAVIAPRATTDIGVHFVRAFFTQTFLIYPMMFWLLALVLLASLAGIGYRQGAIRVAFSLVGILLGALLAGPLARLVKPLLGVFTVKNPTLLWVLAPLVVFVLISIAFKVAAFTVHQKVDVHFKYHAGDLRLALWERLNRRLGLCLGLLNGALYIVLLSFVIYAFSYWTVQVAGDDNDPKLVKILNRLGHDLQSTGFAKVARAIDPMPQVWYESADLAGMIYRNSLLEARLARYPAFLGLAERQEFQDIANDAQFTELRQRGEPIMALLDYPKIQTIVQNPELLNLIWATVVPDLKDLPIFLETGKSPKYDSEKILGRWNFNVNVALSLFRRAKPNITSKEMQNLKRWIVAAYAKTSFVAMTDHQVVLKNVPQTRLPGPGGSASGGLQTLKGQWKDLDGKYQLALTGGAKDELVTATIENARLTMGAEGLSFVFDRED
ncbi:MAG: CvpA family protein [Verrucomicrobia bacterium]|nr:CvpA family protein [Verrucomicrobiota bacterium]